MGYPYQPGGSGGGGSSVYPPNTLSGFTLANNSGTPNTVLNIGVNSGGAMQGGACVDSTNAANINLAAAITKTIASTFTAGTGNGMLDVGSVGASLTYHVYAIGGTGVNDVTCSLCNGNSGTVTISIASPGVVTWANHGLQIGSAVVFTTTGALPTGLTAGTRYYVISAGFTTGAFEVSATQGGSAINTSGSQSGTHTAASNPALASGFTYFRSIGSILTDASSHIVPFLQTGNKFQLMTAVRDVNGGSIGATAALFSISVPVGRKVTAFGGAATSSGSAATTVNDPDLSDFSLAGAGPFNLVNTTATVLGTPIEATTNMSAQIRAKASSSVSLYFATYGWIDTRGTQN